MVLKCYWTQNFVPLWFCFPVKSSLRGANKLCSLQVFYSPFLLLSLYLVDLLHSSGFLQLCYAGLTGSIVFCITWHQYVESHHHCRPLPFSFMDTFKAYFSCSYVLFPPFLLDTKSGHYISLSVFLLHFFKKTVFHKV